MDPQNLSSAQKEELLQRIKQQSEAMIMQDLMLKLDTKCFKLCAGKRGDHLDSSEQQCVVNCMDRYIETLGLVQQVIGKQA